MGLTRAMVVNLPVCRAQRPVCAIVGLVLTFLMSGMAMQLAIAVSVAGERVVVGVLAHRGMEVAVQRWQPTIVQLNDKIPTHNFKLLAMSLEGVQAKLQAGEVDFLITNPGHYIAIAEAFRMTQLASLKTDRTGNPQTGNRYGAVIFVRAQRRDLRTLGDLKNKTFAGVAPDAFGGFLAAVHTFQRYGINPYSELKAIKFMGFPQDEIVLAVLRGDEDAGTVRTGVVESMIKNNRISREDIRILNTQSIEGFELMLSSELFAEWTFAAAQSVSGQLKKSVARVLFDIRETDVAALTGNYGGWNTPMYDGNIRQLLAAVENPAGGIAGAGYVRWIAAGLVAGLLFFSYKYRNFPLASFFRTGTKNRGAEFFRLTRRENQILIHVVAGKTSKVIARELEISPKTVEFHRMHLMKKLGADSLADLIRIALERNSLPNITKT